MVEVAAAAAAGGEECDAVRCTCVSISREAIMARYRGWERSIVEARVCEARGRKLTLPLKDMFSGVPSDSPIFPDLRDGDVEGDEKTVAAGDENEDGGDARSTRPVAGPTGDDGVDEDDDGAVEARSSRRLSMRSSSSRFERARCKTITCSSKLLY